MCSGTLIFRLMVGTPSFTRIDTPPDALRTSSCRRSEAGPEGQPNIGCWPRGPAKVCRPWNVATVKGILTLVKNRLDNLGEYRYIFLLGKHEYCAVYRMSIIFSKPKGHDYIFV